MEKPRNPLEQGPPGLEHPEKEEKYTSRILIHFMRHGETRKIRKGGVHPETRERRDVNRQLTARGRKQSVEKAPDGSIELSVAYGSPRKRSRQTAAFAMAGQLDEIQGDESLEELREKIDRHWGGEFGSKIATDVRLNYREADQNDPFDVASETAYEKGYLIDFIVHDSERLAHELHSKNPQVYSSIARNEAEIVEKYLRIAPRWDELVNDPKRNYGDTMKRYQGSHQGYVEPLLLKVIEAVKGVEERDRLIQVLNRAGFNLTEGFDVEIRNVAEGPPEIRVKYKKEKDGKTVFEFDEKISPELLAQIAHPEQAEGK
jgi:hypothetical protein